METPIFCSRKNGAILVRMKEDRQIGVKELCADYERYRHTRSRVPRNLERAAGSPVYPADWVSTNRSAAYCFLGKAGVLALGDSLGGPVFSEQASAKRPVVYFRNKRFRVGGRLARLLDSTHNRCESGVAIFIADYV